jgi:hypothetical protein
MPGTNTQAYLENLQITAVKSFITLGPRNLQLLGWSAKGVEVRGFIAN